MSRNKSNSSRTSPVVVSANKPLNMSIGLSLRTIKQNYSAKKQTPLFFFFSCRSNLAGPQLPHTHKGFHSLI